MGGISQAHGRPWSALHVSSHINSLYTEIILKCSWFSRWTSQSRGFFLGFLPTLLSHNFEDLLMSFILSPAAKQNLCIICFRFQFYWQRLPITQPVLWQSIILWARWKTRCSITTQNRTWKPAFFKWNLLIHLEFKDLFYL